MRYTLASERMQSEGGLELQNEDGSPMCGECRAVAVPRVPTAISPAILRNEPRAAAPRTFRARKAYTAVRADGLKVTATAEAISCNSQADANSLSLSRARCLAETQAAAGLIPLEAENGAPMFAENQQQLTSEPIAA